MVLLLIAVCIPRFDRNDLFVGGMTGEGQENDSMHYVAMTEIFQGNESAFSPEAPFTYRPLIPLIASIVPLKSMTAINVINLAILFCGILLLGKVLKLYGATEMQRVILLALFIFSFPVFYYGAIGYVDPALIGFLSAGCYFIYKRFEVALIVVLFLGAFVKETVVLLIPVYFVFAMLNRLSIIRAMAVTTTLVVIYIAGLGLARYFSLDPTREVWSPSIDTFLVNASRVRTWVSFVLSFGVPGLVSIIALVTVVIKRRWDLFITMLPWFTGVSACLALFFYSMLSAYSDGRFIWPSSVFALPIVLIYWQQFGKQLLGIGGKA